MTGSRKARKAGEGKELKFEEAIRRLEAIVLELEGPDVPLEKALEMFEEGVRLSKICHRKLSEAEKKVQVLLEDESGGLAPHPFEEEEGAEGGEKEEAGEDEESETLF